MKFKALFAFILAASASVCFAGTGDTAGSGTTGSGSSTSSLTGTAASTSEATNNGNSQSILFTSPGRVENVYSGTTTVRNTPSMGAPNLTTSNDTCMGSGSGAVSVAGFGGAFGKTYTDRHCVLLKDARELWNMGMRAAAIARMCDSDANAAALQATGYACPAGNVGPAPAPAPNPIVAPVVPPVTPVVPPAPVDPRPADPKKKPGE